MGMYLSFTLYTSPNDSIGIVKGLPIYTWARTQTFPPNWALYFVTRPGYCSDSAKYQRWWSKSSLETFFWQSSTILTSYKHSCRYILHPVMRAEIETSVSTWYLKCVNCESFYEENYLKAKTAASVVLSISKKVHASYVTMLTIYCLTSLLSQSCLAKFYHPGETSSTKLIFVDFLLLTTWKIQLNVFMHAAKVIHADVVCQPCSSSSPPKPLLEVAGLHKYRL